LQLIIAVDHKPLLNLLGDRCLEGVLSHRTELRIPLGQSDHQTTPNTTNHQ
jgi:hypothetical protein